MGYSKIKVIGLSSVVSLSVIMASCADSRGFQPKKFPASTATKQDLPPGTPINQQPPGGQPTGQQGGGGQPAGTAGQPGKGTPGKGGSVTPVAPTGATTPPSAYDLFISETTQAFMKATGATADFAKTYMTDANKTAAAALIQGVTVDPETADATPKKVAVSARALLQDGDTVKRVKIEGSLTVGADISKDGNQLTKITWVDGDQKPLDVQQDPNLVVNAFAFLCTGDSCTKGTSEIYLMLVIQQAKDSDHPIYAEFGQRYVMSRKSGKLATNDDGTQKIILWSSVNSDQTKQMKNSAGQMVTHHLPFTSFEQADAKAVAAQVGTTGSQTGNASAQPAGPQAAPTNTAPAGDGSTGHPANTDAGASTSNTHDSGAATAAPANGAPSAGAAATGAAANGADASTAGAATATGAASTAAGSAATTGAASAAAASGASTAAGTDNSGAAAAAAPVNTSWNVIVNGQKPGNFSAVGTPNTDGGVFMPNVGGTMPNVMSTFNGGTATANGVPAAIASPSNSAPAAAVVTAPAADVSSTAPAATPSAATAAPATPVDLSTEAMPVPLFVPVTPSAAAPAAAPTETPSSGAVAPAPQTGVQTIGAPIEGAGPSSSGQFNMLSPSATSWPPAGMTNESPAPAAAAPADNSGV